MSLSLSGRLSRPWAGCALSGVPGRYVALSASGAALGTFRSYVGARRALLAPLRVNGHPVTVPDQVPDKAPVALWVELLARHGGDALEARRGLLRAVGNVNGHGGEVPGALVVVLRRIARAQGHGARDVAMRLAGVGLRRAGEVLGIQREGET